MTKSVKEKERLIRISQFEHSNGELTVDMIKVKINYIFHLKHDQIIINVLKPNKNRAEHLDIQKDESAFRIKRKIDKPKVLSHYKTLYFSQLKNKNEDELKKLIERHLLTVSKYMKIYDWEVSIKFQDTGDLISYNAFIKVESKKHNLISKYFIFHESDPIQKIDEKSLSYNFEQKRISLYGFFRNYADFGNLKLKELDEYIHTLNHFTIEFRPDFMNSQKCKQTITFDNKLEEYYKRLVKAGVTNMEQKSHAVYSVTSNGIFFNFNLRVFHRNRDLYFPIKILDDEKKFLQALIEIKFFEPVENKDELFQHDFETIVSHLVMMQY